MLTKDSTGGKEEYRSSCDHTWSAVLALYEEQCAINVGRTTYKVWVAGKYSVIVPARSVRIIPGSDTAPVGGQIYYNVVEVVGSAALPRGLIMSPGYVTVDRHDRIWYFLGVGSCELHTLHNANAFKGGFTVCTVDTNLS